MTKITSFLFKDVIGPATEIEGAYGRHLSAIKVFGKSIAYIKQNFANHVEKSMEKSTVQFNENIAKWVLTVPAIWNSRAKLVMEAAADMVSEIVSAFDRVLTIGS